MNAGTDTHIHRHGGLRERPGVAGIAGIAGVWMTLVSVIGIVALTLLTSVLTSVPASASASAGASTSTKASFSRPPRTQGLTAPVTTPAAAPEPEPLTMPLPIDQVHSSILGAKTLVPAVFPSSTPAFPGDAGDPDIVYSNGVYYAFTTGSVLGNHIQVLVNSTGNPLSGYESYTGTNYGSTALANPPSWQQINTETSPGVFYWGGRWIMYYDAAQAGHAGDTGYNCLAMATASTLSPTDPQFLDTSTAPFYCNQALGGVIDPSPFIDPNTGNAYLVWKSNDGGSKLPAYLWSAQLNSAGTGFVTAPSELLYNNTVSYPWESTVEDPQMSYISGSYVLLFSGGIWDSNNYGEGYAICVGPTGPCSQPDSTPFLSSYAGVSGPGGGSFFQAPDGVWYLGYAAWTSPAGCYNYTCGGERDLFVAPFSLGQTLNKPIVGMASTPDGGGYWLVASDGGIFSYGDAQFYGSMGGQTLNKPIVGMASTPDGKGYWLVASDGGIFSFGSAQFYGSTGSMTLNKPIVGMASTPDGKGYWLVASDGGIFSYGDAQFYGSMGGQTLNKPIVGMASTPDGGGYWLVASDGGIFSFGSAQFYGSTGSMTLNKPIVAMASTPDGKGYWLVASDGGIFSYGDAQFNGSTGGINLVSPIVGAASDMLGTSSNSSGTPGSKGSSTSAGYWLVASDGGIFSYGTANFFGSPA